MITFYDIASPAPLRTGSPNTWKTRLSLNYKGIPYKTEWVELPDGRATYEKTGAKPAVGFAGQPSYSFPIIKDDSTGVAIGDSFAIAQYLDETYPDTAKLIPDADKQAALLKELEGAIIPAVPLVLKQTYDSGLLTPRAREYFTTTRASLLGFLGIKVATMDEFHMSAEEREDQWRKVQQFFDAMSPKWGGDGNHSWFLGDTISFIDLAMGGMILAQRAIWGVDSKEWKDIMTWNSGKWAKFVDGLKDYEAII